MIQRGFQAILELGQSVWPLFVDLLKDQIKDKDFGQPDGAVAQQLPTWLLSKTQRELSVLHIMDNFSLDKLCCDVQKTELENTECLIPCSHISRRSRNATKLCLFFGILEGILPQ